MKGESQFWHQKGAFVVLCCWISYSGPGNHYHDLSNCVSMINNVSSISEII